MVLDFTKPVDRVRLTVGDTTEMPIFPDALYQQVLDKNSGNESQTALEMAQYLLGHISQTGFRERAAQYEVYGREWLQSYKDFLNTFVTGKNSQMVGTAGMYAGGISVSDMSANDLNTDNNLVDYPSLDIDTTLFDSRWWY